MKQCAHAKLVKTTIFLLLTLLSILGYNRFLDLYGVEEVMMVKEYHDGGATWLDDDHPTYMTVVYKGEVQVTQVNATEKIRISFLEAIKTRKSFRFRTVETVVTDRLQNKDFSGYDYVAIKLKRLSLNTVEFYHNFNGPREYTNRPLADEAVTIGFFSVFLFLLVASWFVFEGIWALSSHSNWSLPTDYGKLPRLSFPGSKYLLVVAVSVILFQFDFWSFGFLVFERTPGFYETLLVWFIVGVMRTLLCVFVASRVKGIRFMDVFGKGAFLAGYFISGLPLIINEVCIHRILDVHVYPEALQRLVPYRIVADLTRGMAREIFGALQIPYGTYLIPYTFLIEPLIIELPRLLIYLLLLGVSCDAPHRRHRDQHEAD